MADEQETDTELPVYLLEPPDAAPPRPPLEPQADKLAERDPAIPFVVWDAEELSALLKNQREIVLDFFGPEWARRFLSEGAAGPGIAEQLQAAVDKALAGTKPRTQFVSLD